MATEQEQTLGSIEKSFDILERLKETGKIGVTELAAQTDLHKSTVHSHLQTLDQLGYVVNEDGLYRLSLQFYSHGVSVRNELPVYRKGRGAIRDLARETGELADLGVLENGRVVVTCIAEGENALQDRSKPGMQLPVHATAMGKAILAYLPQARVDAILDQHGLEALTEQTIADRTALEDELATVREQGFAIDDEEGNEGIYCLAAPILDDEETPVGAVSVCGPAQRMRDEQHHESLKKAVISAANVIEVKIQYEQR